MSVFPLLPLRNDPGPRDPFALRSEWWLYPTRCRSRDCTIPGAASCNGPRTELAASESDPRRLVPHPPAQERKGRFRRFPWQLRRFTYPFLAGLCGMLTSPRLAPRQGGATCLYRGQGTGVTGPTGRGSGWRMRGGARGLCWCTPVLLVSLLNPVASQAPVFQYLCNETTGSTTVAVSATLP